MSNEEAIGEAYKRWGGYAEVTFSGITGQLPGSGRYRVGTMDTCHGVGDSWEEAFENADKNKLT